MLLPSALQRPSGMVLGAFLPAAPALRGTGPSSVNRTARLRIDTRWKDFRQPRQQGLNGDRDHHSRHHFGGRAERHLLHLPLQPIFVRLDLPLLSSAEVLGADVLVLLPQLRRVLPTRGELPGAVGTGASFLTV